jgi:hypothetical protein
MFAWSIKQEIMPKIILMRKKFYRDYAKQLPDGLKS